MKKITFLFAVIVLLTGCSKHEYGTFVDSRDDKEYKTIKIGNQIWMAENLAFKLDSGCWAYDNDEKDNVEDNVETYGYLYDWEAACKVCPDGWHLPSDDEWTILTDFLGGNYEVGKKLKSEYGWRSNKKSSNESGFNALPGGWRKYEEGRFYGQYHIVGEGGFWWSSTSNGDQKAWSRYLNYSNGQADRSYYNRKYGYSVRCVKD